MANRVSPPLGICSWSLQPKNLRELIEKTALVGVSGVQLALEPIRSDPKAWAGAGEELAAAGIKVLSGMFEPAGEDYSTPQTIRDTGGLVPDSTWEENLSRAAEAARIAADLGLEVVSFHAGFLPEDDRAVVVERVKRIADVFGEACSGGVLLETGQETAETLDVFLRALDRPDLGVNFDPANLLLYNTGDPVPALRRLLPRVRQVHLKDARRPTTPGCWGEEVVVGAGEVDWPAFLKVLADSGFTGPLVVEREAGADRIGDIRAAVDFILKILEGIP